eukprot:31439-Pelagococcus_subviridis.AAC.12
MGGERRRQKTHLRLVVALRRSRVDDVVRAVHLALLELVAPHLRVRVLPVAARARVHVPDPAVSVTGVDVDVGRFRRPGGSAVLSVTQRVVDVVPPFELVRDHLRRAAQSAVDRVVPALAHERRALRRPLLVQQPRIVVRRVGGRLIAAVRPRALIGERSRARHPRTAVLRGRRKGRARIRGPRGLPDLRGGRRLRVERFLLLGRLVRDDRRSALLVAPLLHVPLPVPHRVDGPLEGVDVRGRRSEP